MKLLIIFIILNIVNVILQTVKSICTIKSSKMVAALVNGIAYGLYTVVIVYTMCDLPLVSKAIVVASANLIGVYIVKFFEEKAKKDKLWKVEATIRTDKSDDLRAQANNLGLSFNFINIGKYCVFNFYCPNQEASRNVRGLLNLYKAKYFVTETKTL